MKQCPGCKQKLTLEDLMYSPYIVPDGMQIDPTDHAECYFQFTHSLGHCGTSFLIHSREIKHLCDVLAEDWPQSGRFRCPGFCTEIDELASCRRPCSHRQYRQFLLSLWWTRTAPHATAHPIGDSAESGSLTGLELERR